MGQGQIKTYDVEMVGKRGDAGDTFKVRCPECHDDVYVAESGWWDTTCSCGYKWTVNVQATGRKY